MLNAEVPYVRYLIGWITEKFNYINHIIETLLLSVYDGYVDTLSPLIAMNHLDRSCMIVGIFLKLLHSPTM